MPDPTPTTATTATETPTTTAVATTVKSGWATSEHALSVLAIIVSALFVSNVIPTDTVWAKALAVIACVLTSLGYTVSRTVIKTAAILCLVAFGLHTSSGCAWTKHEAQVVETAAVDCTKGEEAKAVKLFSPMLDQLLVLATGGDGKLDTSQLEGATKSLAGDIGGCVLSTSIAKALNPPAAQPGAPQSSPLVIDAVAAREYFDGVRATRFGGKTFQTEAGAL